MTLYATIVSLYAITPSFTCIKKVFYLLQPIKKTLVKLDMRLFLQSLRILAYKYVELL